jgi:hypothetical protein
MSKWRQLSIEHMLQLVRLSSLVYNILMSIDQCQMKKFVTRVSVSTLLSRIVYANITRRINPKRFQKVHSSFT